MRMNHHKQTSIVIIVQCNGRSWKHPRVWHAVVTGRLGMPIMTYDSQPIILIPWKPAVDWNKLSDDEVDCLSDYGTRQRSYFLQIWRQIIHKLYSCVYPLILRWNGKICPCCSSELLLIWDVHLNYSISYFPPNWVSHGLYSIAKTGISALEIACATRPLLF